MVLDTSWLVTALVALTTLLLAKEWYKRRSLPPGPIPLPVIGNLLSFFGKRSANEVHEDYRSRYGDVYTIWVGSVPMVFVNGWQMMKEGLVTKKNDFSGRMELETLKLILSDNVDVAFSDPSPKWERQRRLGHAAVRKYTSTEKFRDTVLEITDFVLDEMLKVEGSICAFDRFSFVVFNIISFMAFGKRYKEDDEEYVFFITTSKEMQKVVSSAIFGQFIPILKPFLWRKSKIIKKWVKESLVFTQGHFDRHKNSYNRTVQDFTDAVLYAREEASPEEEELKNLTDGDLMMVVGNLFNAGNDTMRTTLLWSIMYLCINQDMQEKVAEEIRTVIGDSPPTQEDRNKCPYTWAVILEVLRLNPPAPFLLPHKALFDSSLGGHNIPQGTNVIFNIDTVQKDPAYWKDPEEFRPERFLEDSEIKKSHFLPFGLGRRACIGEKMAQGTNFMLLARLIQRCSFTLDGDPQLTPDYVGGFTMPKKFKFFVKPRNSQKNPSTDDGSSSEPWSLL